MTTRNAMKTTACILAFSAMAFSATPAMADDACNNCITALGNTNYRDVGCNTYTTTIKDLALERIIGQPYLDAYNSGDTPACATVTSVHQWLLTWCPGSRGKTTCIYKVLSSQGNYCRPGTGGEVGDIGLTFECGTM